MTNDSGSATPPRRQFLSASRAIAGLALVGVLGVAAFLLVGSPGAMYEIALGWWRSVPTPIRLVVWTWLNFLKSLNPLANTIL